MWLFLPPFYRSKHMLWWTSCISVPFDSLCLLFGLLPWGAVAFSVPDLILCPGACAQQLRCSLQRRTCLPLRFQFFLAVVQCSFLWPWATADAVPVVLRVPMGWFNWRFLLYCVHFFFPVVHAHTSCFLLSFCSRRQLHLKLASSQMQVVKFVLKLIFILLWTLMCGVKKLKF